MKLDKGVLYSWGSQKSVSVVDILKVSLEKAGWMYFNAGISFTVESGREKKSDMYSHPECQEITKL